MKKVILIRFGELSTKKNNKVHFIKTLYHNVKRKINTNITYDLSRMVIEVDEDEELILSVLKKTFGITEYHIAYLTNNNIDDIKELAAFLIKEKSGISFKVDTKRANKNFSMGSYEVSREVGAHILMNTSFKVDVHNPEIVVNIEIRENVTYVYLNKIPGLGGYPVSSGGRGLLCLSGGIDSPVAGYLAMKRGVRLDAIYFESPPHTSIEALNKVKKLANILNEYGPINLHVVPFTDMQETIYKKVDSTYMITIMRRMMYRICEKYANKLKCEIIVTGESIGQVASQTLTSLGAINEVIKMPVIRPLACFDKVEIIDIAKKINTFETSILPYEDCCTIFVPRHPVVNPSIKKCLEEEKKIDYKETIDDILENIKVVKYKENSEFEDLI